MARLTLKGFKGFESTETPLGRFTVVVGTNASGKSNLRDAFRFLHGLSRGYTLAETIGEKWIEGGVLQWKGIRGGVREVAFDDERTFALAVLSYRREGERSQKLMRLLDLPQAREVLKSENISQLHAAGWLEDAVAFAAGLDGNEEARAATRLARRLLLGSTG